MELKSKIILGTVQFGMDYGINNSAGSPNQSDVNEILNVAKKNFISMLDTSPTYGEAEKKIGNYQQNNGRKFRCITKIPKGITAKNVRETIIYSIETLKSEVYGVLIHDLNTYKMDPDIWIQLQNAQSDGLVQKIGFSVYYPSEIEFLLNRNIDFDLVQLPYNVFDQRFENILIKVKKMRVEVHSRSSFLQGLLFKNINQLDSFFNPVKNKIKALHDLANSSGIALSHLLLGFCLLNEKIDAVVIGVDSVDNLYENLGVSAALDQIKELIPDLYSFIEFNEDIILPILWPQ